MTNATHPTPGYLVECIGLSDAPVFFADANLLSARRAAMSYLETLLTGLWQQNDNATDIQIRLIEADPAAPTETAHHLALIYQRKNIELLTPAVESQAGIMKAWDELHQEFMYYLSHQQHMGMGFFYISIYDDAKADPRYTASILTDALSYAITQDRNLNPNPGDPHFSGQCTVPVFHSMRHLTQSSPAAH